MMLGMAAHTGGGISAIVLAAGRGNRLGEIGRERPKPLMEVGGLTLIDHAIRFIRTIGISEKEIVVVGGYRYEFLKTHLQRMHPSVRTVENPRFELQNLVSFERGIAAVPSDRPVFVCNADYVFREHTAHAVHERMNRLCLYASRDLAGNLDDVMRVSVESGGRLGALSKTLVHFDAVYTGMFFLPTPAVEAARAATNRLMEMCDLSCTTVEHVLLALNEESPGVAVEDIGPNDWFEVDTPEDLEHVRQSVAS